jgi:fermentation-respiration switch protein FrsA (DUF1100 family)
VTNLARNKALKWLFKGLILLALLYLMLRWFEHSQVYFPSRQLDWTPAIAGWPFEDVYVVTADGIRLNGWFIPAQANSPRAQLAVLLLHGNGGNISHRRELYYVLLRAGLNILAIDYRGYGRSEGRPGETGTYLDAETAYHWLGQKGFVAANILVLGESLGAAVAAELALRQPLGGLILQSAFTSIPDIGSELFPWLPVRSISTIKYDTRAKLPRIRIPVLIMHSRADTLVRFQHAEKNFAAANDPKLFEEIPGDHNDTLLTREGQDQFSAGLERFMQRLAKLGLR